jgi:hypothetical protein
MKSAPFRLAGTELRLIELEGKTEEVQNLNQYLDRGIFDGTRSFGGVEVFVWLLL